MNAPASFDTDLVPLYADHLATMKRRADEALARGGFDHLVVPSGTQHWQVFDDRDYPYAVNPQFKAWLPLTRLPYSWLVYTPGERPKVIYYQPFDYWHVVPDAPSGWWVDHCDIHIIRTPDEAAALLPPAARSAILGEPQSALGDHAPNNPEPVIQYLEYQRSYKTPYEIALMRQAQRLAVRGHRAAEAAFRAGQSEFGIHMAYCTAVGQDANELPYGNIIGLNEHAAVLHYMELQRVAPDPLRSFLIDAGASVHGYASDITRSYAYDTGSEFQAMIDAVDAAQQKMCAGVRSGVDYRQLHVDAHHTLMGILKDFGVITVSPEAAVATGVSAAFFPHGLGHPIGLQVHDVAGFAASVDWARVDAFRPYGGIRIEDEVLCTGGDADNLTRPAFEEAD